MTLRRALFACLIALAALLPVSARAQIQPGGSVLIDKTPIVGGTTGRCLYDNAGKIGETASCGLAGGITVGTSVITGGTTTRVLFDNAGVLGEYTNTQLTALINPATSSLSGAAPAFPNNTTTFLRGDGTYQTLNCAALSTATGSCSATYQSTTWTPALKFGGAAVGMTTSTTSGTVGQVGAMLIANFQITLTAKGSSTGVATITGTPCSPVTNVGAFVASNSNNLASITSPVTGYVASGTVNLGVTVTTGFAALTEANFTNTSTIAGSIICTTN